VIRIVSEIDVQMEDERNDNERRNFFIGVGLAVTSCFFIGASFIIKKKGLLRLQSQDGERRAAAGGFGYLRQGIWWLGLISMGVGEGCNFAAYAFAPASLVTPLGGLSVIISAVLASKYLKERMNILAKIGCILCLLGSTVTVIHSPKEKVTTSDELKSMLLDSPFLVYLSFVVLSSLLLIYGFVPKYGNTNVVIYIAICSLIGSISVMTCKGLGLLITEAFGGSNLVAGLFAVFLISTIVTIMIQMNYLNKALDVFDTSVVTPIYYVLFTTCVLVASGILFKEWPSNVPDVLGSICGFFTIIIGIFLLHAFKDLNVTSNFMSRGFRRSHGSSRLINDAQQRTYTYDPILNTSYSGHKSATKSKHRSAKKKSASLNPNNSVFAGSDDISSDEAIGFV
ncbi:hypothetical protein B4U80_08264, partial [Leptotrombidium deliense]